MKHISLRKRNISLRRRKISLRRRKISFRRMSSIPFQQYISFTFRMSFSNGKMNLAFFFSPAKFFEVKQITGANDKSGIPSRGIPPPPPPVWYINGPDTLPHLSCCQIPPYSRHIHAVSSAFFPFHIVVLLVSANHDKQQKVDA